MSWRPVRGRSTHDPIPPGRCEGRENGAQIGRVAPLDLEGVKRVRLGAGASGDWPVDFSAAEAQDMHVDQGTVKMGAAGGP